MRRLIPVVAMAVLLTGCKVKVDQGFELNSDGSGKASVVFGFDEELMELMGSFAPEGDPLADLTTDLPAGWESADWSEGEFTGIEASTAFNDLAGLRSIAATVFSGADGLFDTFTVETTEGDGFRFEATMSGETLEQGLQGVEGFDLGGSVDDLSETFFDAEIFVKLPGEIVTHNADSERSDGTLVWNVHLTDSGRVISAESAPGGSLPLLPIASAAAVVLVAALGFVLWNRRSSRPINGNGDSFVAEAPAPVGEAPEGDPFG